MFVSVGWTGSSGCKGACDSEVFISVACECSSVGAWLLGGAAVEVSPALLWCGVPVSVHSTGVNSSSVPSVNWEVTPSGGWSHPSQRWSMWRHHNPPSESWREKTGVPPGPKLSPEPMLDHHKNSWPTLTVLLLVFVHDCVCHGFLWSLSVPNIITYVWFVDGWYRDEWNYFTPFAAMNSSDTNWSSLLHMSYQGIKCRDAMTVWFVVVLCINKISGHLEWASVTTINILPIKCEINMYAGDHRWSGALAGALRFVWHAEQLLVFSSIALSMSDQQTCERARAFILTTPGWQMCSSVLWV